MERFLKFTYQWEYITEEILKLDEPVNSLLTDRVILRTGLGR